MSNYGLRTLSRDECVSALRSQRVGRIGLGGDHPLVLPVLYGLLDGDVVYRTAPGEKLIAAVLHHTVAFEVDDYDSSGETGWSVNVVGTPEEIVNPAELERAHALDLPCWAGELRDRYVRIRATEITGRAIDPEPGVGG